MYHKNEMDKNEDLRQSGVYFNVLVNRQGPIVGLGHSSDRHHRERPKSLLDSIRTTLYSLTVR